MEQQWLGFSPGPVSVNMSPEHQSFEFSNLRRGGADQDQPESPLVFMRTPGVAVHENTCPDSSKRFNSWMESTSPYTARKTPPTASMKSMAAGDENTPPAHDMARGVSEKDSSSFGSHQHFQSWLRATSSTSWTPRKSPAAGTPPPAPAPSPAGTPMSIMRDLQHSAATPPTAHHLQPQGAQRTHMPAAAGDGFDTSEDEDDAGEASTSIGAAQVAAAADRAAAASRMAGQRAQAEGSRLTQPQQQRQLSTPPRVPAPSPLVNSPAPLGLQQQQASLLQAAADRMAQDSLATPMSQLSISRRAGGQHGSAALTPGMLLDRGASQAVSGPPASPAEKLIGLMLSPGADGLRRHHHQQQPGQQLTPSRLSATLGAASNAQAPMSPNMQVIDLMMHPDAAAAEGLDSSAGAGLRAAQQQAHTQQDAAAAVADEEENFVDSISSGSGSEYDSESDDEMDLSELQALVGEGVGPDTPLSVILGMLTGTPEVRGLTPHIGAAEQQGGNDDIGPRVLFADD